MLTCPRCGQENPDGARFCNACAAPLALAETEQQLLADTRLRSA